MALDSASLAIQTGSVHAIAGENGAGKSTLIKIFAGVHEPDEGEVVIRGVAQRIPNPRVAQELRLGFLHQRLNLVSSLSVRENMLLTSTYPTSVSGGSTGRRSTRAARRALETAGIDVEPTRPSASSIPRSSSSSRSRAF